MQSVGVHWIKYFFNDANTLGEWLAVTQRESSSIQCYTMTLMNPSCTGLWKMWVWQLRAPATFPGDLSAPPRTYIGQLTATYKSSSGARSGFLGTYTHMTQTHTCIHKQKLSEKKSSKKWGFFQKIKWM